MVNKIDIRQLYERRLYRFGSSQKTVGMPMATVILKNIKTGVEEKATQSFLVDTGALISIINEKGSTFVEQLSPCDKIYIKYGGGDAKWCDVYEVGVIIQRQEIIIQAAYDKNSPYSVLGHYSFLQNFDHCVFSSKDYKLIKKYR